MDELTEYQSLEERQKGWVAAILEAQQDYMFGPALTRDRRLAIEDRLLRRLGFRAPLDLVESLSDTEKTRADARYIRGREEMRLLARYLFLLSASAEDGALEAWNQDPESVALKRLTWACARRVFQELGGGSSDIHIRTTLQRLARIEPGKYRFPVPTGDPPTVKF